MKEPLSSALTPRLASIGGPAIPAEVEDSAALLISDQVQPSQLPVPSGPQPCQLQPFIPCPQEQVNVPPGNCSKPKHSPAINKTAFFQQHPSSAMPSANGLSTRIMQGDYDQGEISP